jgi:type II secretory pathway component HofQ
MADPDMLFDFTLKDADLRDALRDFFTQAGRAYMLEDDLDGTITLHATDLRFIDALRLLLPADFAWTVDHDMYHIRKAKAA